MKLLAALIVPAAILIAIAAFETGILSPAPSNRAASGIVWRGSTFATRADFARWLRSRGIRYEVWARRHPSLAGVAANRNARPSTRAASKTTHAGQNGSDWTVQTLGGGAVVFLAGLGVGVLLVRRRQPAASGASATSIDLSARRSVRSTERAARLVLGAAERARPYLSVAKSSVATGVENGTKLLGALGRGAAPAAGAGGRLLLRCATSTAVVSRRVAAASAHEVRRRPSEFGWYLASGLLAAAIGVLATMLLNGV